MPKMTPGNRLYLYRLLSRQLGVGRQSNIRLVDEALESDGLAPRDLGCETARELCEQLSECVKLTVFKKGAVFATVLPNEEYQKALERDASGEGKSAAKGGKPWKRRRGAKALKPVRPRHVEPEPPAAERAPKAEPRHAAKAEGPATPEAPLAGQTQSADAPQPVVDQQAAAERDAASAAASEGQADAIPAVVPAAAAADGTAQDDVAAGAGPAPVQTAPAAPVCEDSRPKISFTITYVPEQPADDGQPIDEQPAAVEPTGREQPAVPGDASLSPAEHDAATDAKPAPVTATDAAAPSPAPAPAPAPRPATAATPSHAPAQAPGRPTVVVPTPAIAHLPQDFYAEVRCPNEQLSMLYQLLPCDVDPMSVLEEDFRVARSTGAVEGTRSTVAFPLRYQRADGKAPVTVTLRRSAKATAGKYWSLCSVDGGSVEEVGLEGLSERESPVLAAERQLAQHVVLGDWGELLGALAGMAQPEQWGASRRFLRAHLALTAARVRARGLLAVSQDGTRACFDTGLSDRCGSPVYARLVANDGDIPWRLEGFSPSGDAPRASYVDALWQVTVDPSLVEGSPAACQAAVRCPRLATTAYDPIDDRVVLLVPEASGDGALALVAADGRYEAVQRLSLDDAYACARAVSGQQPSWLARALS